MRPTALLLPWALLPILQVSAMWPFSNNKPPAKEGLVNAGHLGLEGFDGRVVALGDWNGDQLYVIGLSVADVTD
jgi:integrin alpha FG-GAP repeat containing protein 1